jgi:hypothetical protein
MPIGMIGVYITKVRHHDLLRAAAQNRLAVQARRARTMRRLAGMPMQHAPEAVLATARQMDRRASR